VLCFPFLVFDLLIKAGLPAFPLPPSAFITSKNKQLDQISVLPLINLLNFNAIPLIYGDVITDSEIGCTIYSTEKVLNEIAKKLRESGYKPEMIIEVGNTKGVLNKKGETIKEINATNIKSVLALLSETSTIDVTGGMIHKVNEAYSLAKNGIPTLIISAEKGNLKKGILGQKINGTWVRI
jgi:isopentenyl phosphate kinase